MDEKAIEFYKRLKDELDTTTEKWPSEYLYKFIVPANTGKELDVEKAFDGMGAVIKNNVSKTGKYVSISINVFMPDSDSIIEKYKEVSSIEGIISL